MDHFEDVAECLPPVVLDMVDLIGFPETEKLVKAFGGVSFRFTDGVVYFPKLLKLLGKESAVKLRQYFRSEQVYIPRCDAALRILRNRRFKADFDYLTSAQGESARMAMLTLCPKYQISDRYGWKIIKTANTHSSQANLF